MQQLRSRIMVAILCGCGTLVLGDCAIVAQAGPPAPGVRVARDPRLTSASGPRMWTAMAQPISCPPRRRPLAQRAGVHRKRRRDLHAPIQSSFSGFVIGVGDFSGDSNPDVVASSYAARDSHRRCV